MRRKELIQELISVAAPIFIKKALQYLSEGKSPTEDDIIQEVIAECEVVQSEVKLSDSATISETRYVGPFGDLTATLCDIVEDLARDIKDQIKQELMMTIHTELDIAKEQISSDLSVAKKIESSNASSDFAPPGGLPQFSVTDDVPLDEIKVGFDSIKQYDVSLKGHPLFAMVQKSLDRSAAGLSAHSAEDLIAARANRSDQDANNMIARAEAKYNEDMSKPFGDYTGAARPNETHCGDDNDAPANGFKPVDDDVSSNDALWDKMFADKYGAK